MSAGITHLIINSPYDEPTSTSARRSRSLMIAGLA